MNGNSASPRRSLLALPRDMWFWGSACEIAKKVRCQEMSVREAVQNSLTRIAQVNPIINCFCAVYAEDALAAADAWDRRIASDNTPELPPLVGVPFALKDLTPVSGKITSYGCRAFADQVTNYDPVLLKRLRAAGAILVGKTTTSELASAALTESELCGITRNPWDLARTPGGSSGGSAAAVASGCVPIAEGSDIGGSIRSPAAYCGVVGMKPSSGRIPMDIMPTLFDGMMHFGPIAATVEDAALFLDVTAGPDDADILSLPAVGQSYANTSSDITGLRLAINLDYGYYGLQPEVRQNILQTAEYLRSRGAIVEHVELNWSQAIDEAWYAGWKVYLAAFYGEAIDRAPDLFGEVVKSQLIEGRAISAIDYKQIELLRSAMWRDLARIFASYDALLLPATTRTAPQVGLSDAELFETDSAGRMIGVSMHFHTNFVPQCPSLSLPVGFGDGGLPTAIQILGRRYDDWTVLRIASAIEGAPFAGTRRYD